MEQLRKFPILQSYRSPHNQDKMFPIEKSGTTGKSLTNHQCATLWQMGNDRECSMKSCRVPSAKQELQDAFHNLRDTWNTINNSTSACA